MTEPKLIVVMSLVVFVFCVAELFKYYKMDDVIFQYNGWIILVTQSIFTGKWSYEASHKVWKQKFFYDQNFPSMDSALIDARSKIITKCNIQ